MKILLVSDGPFHTTGYGTQIDVLSRKMAADGHKVFVYAPGAFHFAETSWADGITVLGGWGGDRWGNEGLINYLLWLTPDVVITWLDCQGLTAYGWTPVPTIMWAPIDTTPIPMGEVGILNRAAHLLSPSRWGQEVLASQGLESTYVPCGLDTDLFDIDDEARKRWRAAQTPPIAESTFLVGMVGLNSGSPDRKGYGYALDIMRRFMDAYPDEDIQFYLHTNAEGDQGAINLLELRTTLGLGGVMHFPPPRLPFGAAAGYMRDMYNGFDVFLHTSLTEGFGLPVIEAQSCGTPAVVNAATSISELVMNGGKAKPLTDMWVNTTTKIFVPDVSAMLKKLEKEYRRWKEDAPEKRLRRRKAIRATTLRFNWDDVYERYWRPVLADIPAPVTWDDGPRKLMLGAGGSAKQDKEQGFVTHDLDKFSPDIDVAHDLTIFPWPWDDDSFDYVQMVDVIEHLRPHLVQTVDELWRITAPDGYVAIHTCEAGSWQLMTDPTHVRGFTLDSFDYFDPDTDWGRTYTYSTRQWKLCMKTVDSSGLLFVLQPRKEKKEDARSETIREIATAIS